MNSLKSKQAFIGAKLGTAVESLLDEIVLDKGFDLMTNEEIAETVLERMPSKEDIAFYVYILRNKGNKEAQS